MWNIEICVRTLDDYNIAKGVFDDMDFVKVVKKSITDATYSTIVSAGNSFAEMNGGCDGVINSHLSAFTPDHYIQEDVKKIINEEYLGELPVGTSILVKTAHPKHTHLIYTPTMRVATEVENTINPYLAMRSILVVANKYKIPAFSMTLLCTGAGNFSVYKSCCLVKEAIISTKSLIGGDWPVYHQHQKLLNSIVGKN